MKPAPHTQPPIWPRLAWLSAAVAGFVAPALTVVVLGIIAPNTPLITFGGPILAVGLMGTGMIAAAADGRLWVGVALSQLAGAGLTTLTIALGLQVPLDLPSLGLATLIACISFAARGALFARSGADKGWWIAVFVVAGEAAIVLTALAQPGALPDWLLALLPAQWAAIAIQSALAGGSSETASAALIALGGTALATLLVAWLWPRRWTYLIMFTTWLALSALVYNSAAPPKPQDGLASAGTKMGQPPHSAPPPFDQNPNATPTRPPVLSGAVEPATPAEK